MRILFFVLLCFFVPLFGAHATNRFLEWVFDTVEGNKAVYSLGTNYNAYGAVPDHTIFFKNFPYTDTICLWSTNFTWHGQTVNLCSGYSTAYMNQGNKTNVGNRSNRCWYWTCNSGYSMQSGGQCAEDRAGCINRGMLWENNQCVAPNFCPGWTGYDSSNYTMTGRTSANCFEFRCKNGGFMSQTNRACKTDVQYNQAVANIPAGRGGWYVNNNRTDNDRGVLLKCGDDMYVTINKATNEYMCGEVERRESASFNNCWKCTSKPELINCIRGSATCGN
ncbi:MAG: hypothetical protein LBQ49_03040 [Rickettsiales bacterium]|nr:hypothetical protein [Rickettsiales bacterium]